MKVYLISADTILPISSDPIHNGSILISNGIINDVGTRKNLKKKYDKVQEINLKSGILLPGFINSHTHLELGWMKNKITNFNGFTGWLEKIIKSKATPISEDVIKQSVREGIEEIKECGITTVGEISSYGGLDKPLLKNSGLRTILFREITDSKENEYNLLELEKGDLFEERNFPHAAYSCTPQLLKKVLNCYNENNTPIAIHLAESPDEVSFLRGEKNGFEDRIFPLIGKDSFTKDTADTPLKYLTNIGFFKDNKVSTIHMVQVFEQDIESIIENDIGIILCPRSNHSLNVGLPPIEKYHNIERIGLGTDGISSNFNLDFLEELKFLYSISKETLGEKSYFFTVYSGTLGSARSLFIEDRVGSIEKGKEADLIFIKKDSRSTEPYQTVVCSHKEDIHLSLVKGRIVHSKLNNLKPYNE